MKLIFLPFLAALGMQAPVAANTAQANEAGQGNTVVIRQLRHPETMPYASFVEARKVHEQYRDLAPEAPLLFQIKTRSGKLDGMRVRIEGDNTTIAVPYDEEGRFSLPHSEEALRDKALVTSDMRRGQIYWLPVVRSPGLPEGTLRLGDLRLFCRMQWALEKAAASVMTKLTTMARGNCDASAFITLALPQPGMRVRLVAGQRREMLASEGEKSRYVAQRTRWEPPFGDLSWPNDTLVEFLPPEEGFALSAECQAARDKDADGLYRHSYGTFGRQSCVWRPH